MKKKTLFLSIIFSIMFVLCCGFLLPNNIGTVYASGEATDTYSFTSAGESNTGYYENCGGVQDENRIINSDCIKISYNQIYNSTKFKYKERL